MRVSGCYYYEDLMAANGGPIMLGENIVFTDDPRAKVCFSQWSDVPTASGLYLYNADVYDAAGRRLWGGPFNLRQRLVRPDRTVSFDAIGDDGESSELLDPWANDTPFTPFLMSNYRNSLAAMELRPGILYAAGSVVAFGGLIALMRR